MYTSFYGIDNRTHFSYVAMTTLMDLPAGNKINTMLHCLQLLIDIQTVQMIMHIIYSHSAVNSGKDSWG